MVSPSGIRSRIAAAVSDARRLASDVAVSAETSVKAAWIVALSAFVLAAVVAVATIALLVRG